LGFRSSPARDPAGCETEDCWWGEDDDAIFVDAWLGCGDAAESEEAEGGWVEVEADGGLPGPGFFLTLLLLFPLTAAATLALSDDDLRGPALSSMLKGSSKCALPSSGLVEGEGVGGGGEEGGDSLGSSGRGGVLTNGLWPWSRFTRA
jgi:hypothetical protein